MSKSAPTVEIEVKKATLLFEPDAWLKMFALVNAYKGEVQWQGTVKRLSENKFAVEKIVIFPHEVSSVSVLSEQAEYEEFMRSLDRETYKNLRLHGHSHVDMSVTPSALDYRVREHSSGNLANPFPGYDPFLIFMIVNKRGDIHCFIHDRANKIDYDTENITLAIKASEYETLADFVAKAKSLTRERNPVKMEEDAT